VSDTATAPRSGRWVKIGALIALGVVTALTVVFFVKFPFKRDDVEKLLRRKSGGTVEIGRFQKVYFPRAGFDAEQIVIRFEGTAGPPLISIGRAWVRASYPGLLTKPERIDSIRVEGLRIHIPKSTNRVGGDSSGPADQMVLGEIVTDNAVLEFEPDTRFDLRHVALHNAAADRALRFEASLRVPEPPGEVSTTGSFGPWDGWKTPVLGSYQFRHADLGKFEGLAGLLASDGSFRGNLSNIQVDGWTDVPHFEANQSGHTVHLGTQFHARVNGSNGDVFLDQVTAALGRSQVFTSGAVVDGKATLQMSLARARIEDFLHMLLEARTPGLFGAFTAQLAVELPPGDQSFLQKLRMAGDFGVASATFGSPKTQQGVDQLSRRAQGEKESQEDPARVLSDLKGHLSLRHGIAHLNNLSFTVPGALVKLDGTYDMLRRFVHLQGTLHTQATVSETTHGIKSFLLKPLDALFKNRKRHEGAVLPIHITGPYNDVKVTVVPLPAKKKS
jgi:hypothetical protein